VTNIASPSFVTGLAELAPAYRALLCDVWGVVHNGAEAHPPAVAALTRYREGGGIVLLISNAARPVAGVVEMLDRLGVPHEAYDDVISSGGAARSVLAQRPGTRVYHVGPEHGRAIYEGLALDLVDEDECDLISCTGLFDDETETPDDYQARLAGWRARNLPMLCANPDIVVERGDRLVWCAGALAERYRALGGQTLMIGKPHRLVYELAMKRIADLAGEPVAKQSVLAIGDAVDTDVRGAVEQGMDVLFVTSGIHVDDFGPRDAPDLARVQAKLAASGLAARAVVKRLTWEGGA